MYTHIFHYQRDFIYEKCYVNNREVVINENMIMENMRYDLA